MRRILFTVLASAALCAAAPTVALAHNGHQHHHKRHHHARVRHEKFFAHHHDGDQNGNPANTAPTAGTVTSFANNVLTITLTKGNTVSGEVTSDTEIKCENPEMQNGDNDGDEHGDAVFHHADGGGGDNGDRGDDNGNRADDNDNNEMCTPTPGMALRNAELTINGNGAFWDEVELVNSSSSSTGSQP